MSCVISRWSHDDWYFDLYEKINQILPTDVESYYFFSEDEGWDGLVSMKFKTNTVFLFILDSLHYQVEYDPMLHNITDRAATLYELCTQYKHIKFIVSTSLDNLEAEISLPNVHFLCHGNLHLNPLEPGSIDKNSTVSNTFICLNRTMKMHRLITASYLFGQDLEKFGHISFDANAISSDNSWLDKCNWQLTPYQQNAHAPILHNGFLKIKQNCVNLTKKLEEVNLLYSTSNNSNNALNFESNLRKLYQDSFVQIVTESVFAEATIMVSEKTAQSFYGANFPIIIGNVGTIKYLRKVGFDMFDDIVDHGYDNETNRLTRITKAIDSNKKLLTDINYAAEKWQQSRSRFLKNIEFLNHGASDYYVLSVLDQIKKIFNTDLKKDFE